MPISATLTATLTLSNIAAGALSTGTSGAVTSTYTAATGVWSASGATANVNALLAGVIFTPAANFNANFTIATSISDGTTTPVTGTKAFTGIAVNDAPTLTAAAANPTFTEGAGSSQAAAVTAFSGTAIDTIEAGQAITRLALSVGGLVDGASEHLVIDGSNFALTDGATGTTATNGFSYTVAIVGTTATVTLAKAAGVTAAAAQTVVNAIAYQNTNIDNPTAGDRTITLTSVSDDGGIANGGADTMTVAIASTVHVTPVDDLPVAINDATTATEAAPVTIAVVANDTDIDGGAKAVATVNGATLSAGQTTTLASGAVVTLNADGTLGYDPHGAFGYLNAQSSTVDQFAYTLNGGSAATVSVTVTGIAGAGDANHGSAGNDVIVGTGYIDASQGGDDTVTGSAANDGFFFGAAFTGADRVDGGGGTNDQIGLQGNYTGGNALVLQAATITNIEWSRRWPGSTTTSPRSMRMWVPGRR